MKENHITFTIRLISMWSIIFLVMVIGLFILWVKLNVILSWLGIPAINIILK